MNSRCRTKQDMWSAESDLNLKHTRRSENNGNRCDGTTAVTAETYSKATCTACTKNRFAPVASLDINSRSHGPQRYVSTPPHDKEIRTLMEDGSNMCWASGPAGMLDRSARSTHTTCVRSVQKRHCVLSEIQLVSKSPRTDVSVRQN